MLLKDIRLHGDREIERKYDRIMPIRWQAYHITELFRYFLPKIKIDEGNGVLQIDFYCDKEDEFKVQYYEITTTEKSYGKVQINAYLYKMTQDEINEYYLNIIIKSIMKIAETNNIVDEVKPIVIEIENKIRECGFEIEYKLKRLSKLSTDRKYMANVYRKLDKNGELVYIEFVDKKTKLSKCVDVKGPSIVEWSAILKKPYWKDNHFYIEDRIEVEVDVDISEVF